MKKEIEISIPHKFIDDNDFIKNSVAKKLGIAREELDGMVFLRRSIDARKSPVYRIRLVAFVNEYPHKEKTVFRFRNTDNALRVVVVGSGPAGLYAALRLLEHGIKPIVLERGEDVRTRRRALKKIMLEGEVNENSNYAFGEGGAGTYSDGKLYTRSKKRGNVKRALDLLVYHGADEDITVDSHPHIGSNKLPKIIERMRETILTYGGEIRFNAKVTDFIILNGTVRGVIVNEAEEISADAVIVAAGHSARDVWEIFARHNLRLEAKPFALGVRIEHPQPLIDAIQYKIKTRPLTLPAASYSLTNNYKGRGIYSFCMCPGGIIIPASTRNDELVLNGMSVSKRNSPFANSGLVVSVKEDDWMKYNKFGYFAALEFQKEVERAMFLYGGGRQTAPAQRLTDFVNRKISADLPRTSYKPGTVSAPLHEILPSQIVEGLQKSLPAFGRKMRGFYTEEAVLLAPESRTSSPVKVPRKQDTLEHVDCENLFPAGEGAGYAGGIISAAMDGEKVADAVATKLNNYKF